MAAPMDTARIGLLFDQPSIENSWFLVDYSKHKHVDDVASEIKENFLKLCSNDSARLVLKINNFFLPPSGSSKLFRENDVVSVRLEKYAPSEFGSGDNCSHHGDWMFSNKDSGSVQHRLFSTLVDGSSINIHKRKKTESESVIDLDESSSLPKPKKARRKHKELKSTTENLMSEVCGEMPHTDGTLAQEDDRSKVKKAKKKKKKKSERVESPVENVEMDVNSTPVKNIEPDSSFTETQGEDIQEKQDSVDQNDSISTDTGTKHKRKRTRKRHSKSSKSFSLTDTLKMCNDQIQASVNNLQKKYVENDVDRSAGVFYGALPDKLENPKQYRHGYRNLNKYDVKPNEHRRFSEGSNAEGEEGNVEENTRQYNFLCKLRKLADTDLSNGIDISDPVENISDSVENSNYQKSTNSGNPVNSSGLSASVALENISESNRNRMMTNSQNNSYHSEQGQSENSYEETYQNEFYKSDNQTYSAVPLQYNEANFKRDTYQKQSPIGDTSAMKASPVTLDRKTMANGVSVFVRQRPSPAAARFREMSKHDQLNTVATNVSTIFTNPTSEEFKKPESPAVKPKSTSEKSFPSHDSIIPNNDTCTSSLTGLDLKNFTPLSGQPKPGDTIAYKVLEISAGCTPEISHYKIAKVLSVDDQQMLELKILNKHEKEKNKFHVEIEDEDGILTNTEDEDVVWLHLSSLIQPVIKA